MALIVSNTMHLSSFLINIFKGNMAQVLRPIAVTFLNGHMIIGSIKTTVTNAPNTCEHNIFLNVFVLQQTVFA